MKKIIAFLIAAAFRLDFHAQTCFSQSTDFSTGNLPEFIGSIDFNFDGSNDLYITNYNDGTVTIKFGDGNGNFSSTQTLLCGSNPYGADAGDANSTGYNDLVVANTNANTLSYFENIGSVSSVAYTIPNTPQNPFDVEFGNFDLIEGLEIVTCGYTQGVVQLANVSGMIGDPIAVGPAPMNVAVANVNLDGLDDIITANSGDNTISLVLSNVNLAFNSAISYTVGNSPRGLAIADMNLDGLDDVVVACDGSDSLYVLLNNGLGTLNEAYSIHVPSGGSSVAAADFNNDGLVDLALGTYSPMGVTVCLNQGNNNFTNSTNFPIDGGLYALTACDLNSDQKIDIATANYFEHNGSILFNQYPSVTLNEMNGSLIAISTSSQALFQWLDCNNELAPIADATDASFVYPTGSFAVQINVNGCSSTSECMDVEAQENSVAERSNEYSIYPNPAANSIRISKWNGDVKISDMHGRIVLSHPNYRSHSALDLTMLAEGTYVLMLVNADQSIAYNHLFVTTKLK